MKKIYIHIGLHKTGSTFLQNKVFPKLKETTYIGRPYTQQSIAFNKLQYADSSLYSEEETIMEIKNFEKHEKILISDEMLSGLPFNNYINRTIIADRLSKIFPDATILLFLRSQKDLLLSLYNSYIKNNSGFLPINQFIWYPSKAYSYQDYAKSSLGWDFNTRYFNHMTHSVNPACFLYKELIDYYKIRFKSLNIFLYEDLANNPKSILDQIESLLKDKIEGKEEIDTRQKVNSSLISNSLLQKREENKAKLVTKNKNLIRLITFIQLMNKNKSYKNELDYVSSLVNDFYQENNQLVLQEYPFIGIDKYPEKYPT